MRTGPKHLQILEMCIFWQQRLSVPMHVCACACTHTHCPPPPTHTHTHTHTRTLTTHTGAHPHTPDLPPVNTHTHTHTHTSVALYYYLVTMWTSVTHISMRLSSGLIYPFMPAMDCILCPLTWILVKNVLLLEMQLSDALWFTLLSISLSFSPSLIKSVNCCQAVLQYPRRWAHCCRQIGM